MERKKTEGNAERDCMSERLNRLSEWVLSGKTTGWIIKDENMRHILK